MIVVAAPEHPKLPDKADPFWVTVWFETGFADLCMYLLRHAKFDEYLLRHGKPRDKETP